MQSHTSNIAWRETGLLTFIGIMTALLASYVPVLQSIMILIFALLVALLVRKHHLTIALLSLLVVTVVAFLINDNLPAVFSFLVEAGVIGLATGLLFKNRLSPEQSLKIIIILSVVIAILLLLSLAYFAGGINPFVMEKDLLDEIYQANRWYVDTNVLSLEEQQQLDQYVKEFIGLIAVLVPGSMVIWSIIRGFIIYLFAYNMFNRLGYNDQQLPPFHKWQYPWYVIWGLITGLILLLAGDEWNLVLISNLGKNIIYVMSFLFLVLGISVFVYFIKKWKIPGIFKGLVIFIICLYWPLGLGLVLILGLIDPVLNLRQTGVESGQGGKQ